MSLKKKHKIKRKINKRTLILCSFFVMAAGAVLIPALLKPDSAAVFNTQTAPEGEGMDFDYNSGAAFYSYQSNHFFYCTKDGIKYMSAKGAVKWEDTFNLTAPALSGKCGIVAVSEPKGHTVCVYDEKGKLFEQRFDDPILSFSVNQTGYLTIILQKADGYLIEVYARNPVSNDSGGFERLLYYEFVDPNVYPVSADTSPDGRVTAVGFLDVNVNARADITSRVTFMYIRQNEAQDFPDGIFAGEDEKEDQIISAVRFMENNKLLVVSEGSVDCLWPQADNQVKTEWSVTLHNKIDQLAFDGDKGFAFITGDPLLNDPAPEKNGTLFFYDMAGKKLGSHALGVKADSLSLDWNSALVSSGRTYCAVNFHGRLLWKYTATQDIRQMIFLENKDTVLMADNRSASVRKRG